MTRRCVVDASSTLTWLYSEGEDPDALEATLQGISMVVPSLWRLEVVHSLLRRQRSGRHDPRQFQRWLDVLVALSPEVLALVDRPTLPRLFDLAKPHQLGSYDAVYLDAALRHRLPLLTHDRNLRLAAEAEGVEVW